MVYYLKYTWRFDEVTLTRELCCLRTDHSGRDSHNASVPVHPEQDIPRSCTYLCSLKDPVPLTCVYIMRGFKQGYV